MTHPIIPTSSCPLLSILFKHPLINIQCLSARALTCLSILLAQLRTLTHITNVSPRYHSYAVRLLPLTAETLRATIRQPSKPPKVLEPCRSPQRSTIKPTVNSSRPSTCQNLAVRQPKPTRRGTFSSASSPPPLRSICPILTTQQRIQPKCSTSLP